MSSNTSKLPEIIVTNRALCARSALGLLAQPALNTVLSLNQSADELIHTLRNIDNIFTDADGSLVEMGHNVLSSEYARCIADLSKLNVRTTVVTGKPYSEIERLLHSVPKGLSLRIICEKGAYYLDPDTTGTLRKRYLLSTPELEYSVREFRKIFESEKVSIERRHPGPSGKQQITLGWAGDGTHESVLSIDILAGVPPANYLGIKGIAREQLKVSSLTLRRQVLADLQAFTERHRPGWQVVDLDNANIEITPRCIEKDEAILAMPDFAAAQGVLVLGDSANDARMFGLRRFDKVRAGLVLHNEKMVELLDTVDFATFGMANLQPVFQLLLAAVGQ